MLKRLNTILKRKSRARKLGFRFTRAAGFILPSEIKVGITSIRLVLPEDNGTRTAFIDLLLDDCYLLQDFPDDINTVADIGSHVGLFSIAARNRWPHAVIHAYEPNQALRGECKHHAEQADFSAYSEAVGGKSGSVNLISNGDTVQVRVVETNDGVIKQVAFKEVLSRLGGRVDLVKLDCEGGEWAILHDVESWKNVRFLTMEFHLWAGYTLDELTRHIYDLGFKITHLEVTGPDFGILAARR